MSKIYIKLESDYDRLCDALETIKITCDKNSEDGCVNCPLGDKNGICKLSICPNQWLIRHPETEAFRVIE